MSDKLDAFWVRIKKMAGQCAANTDLEDLKASAETAKGRIDKVLMGGKLLQKDSQVFEKLSKANEALGAIGESLGKVQNVCLDIGAVTRIHGAMKKLDTDLIYNDPEAAAEAFGQLFVGFGRLCRYLPSPGKEWGQFLESAGDFFSNMQRAFNPATRPAYRSQWSQIEGT